MKRLALIPLVLSLTACASFNESMNRAFREEQQRQAQAQRAWEAMSREQRQAQVREVCRQNYEAAITPTIFTANATNWPMVIETAKERYRICLSRARDQM